MIAKVEVQNVPKDADKYIVARVILGELWYWESWDDEVTAEMVAAQFENGLVLEVDNEAERKVEK